MTLINTIIAILIIYIALVIFLFIKNKNKDISVTKDEYDEFIIYAENYNKKKNG